MQEYARKPRPAKKRRRGDWRTSWKHTQKGWCFEPSESARRQWAKEPETPGQETLL